MTGGAYQHICHKGDPELSQLVSVSEHNDISKYNTVEGEHHLLKNHAPVVISQLQDQENDESGDT